MDNRLKVKKGIGLVHSPLHLSSPPIPSPLSAEGPNSPATGCLGAGSSAQVVGIGAVVAGLVIAEYALIRMISQERDRNNQLAPGA